MDAGAFWWVREGEVHPRELVSAVRSRDLSCCSLRPAARGNGVDDRPREDHNHRPIQASQTNQHAQHDAQRVAGVLADAKHDRNHDAECHGECEERVGKQQARDTALTPQLVLLVHWSDFSAVEFPQGD